MSDAIVELIMRKNELSVAMERKDALLRECLEFLERNSYNTGYYSCTLEKRIRKELE